MINNLRLGRKFVNYRDCKLTRLLKDSLGGQRCHTHIVVTLSPQQGSAGVNEILSTLAFAENAKHIVIRGKARELEEETWDDPNLSIDTQDLQELSRARIGSMSTVQLRRMLACAVQKLALKGQSAEKGASSARDCCLSESR